MLMPNWLETLLGISFDTKSIFIVNFKEAGTTKMFNQAHVLETSLESRSDDKIQVALQAISEGSLFSLQSAILDIIQSPNNSIEKFEAVLELLKNAFGFDATMFFAASDSQFKDSFFVSTDKSIEIENVKNSIKYLTKSVDNNTVSIAKIGSRSDHEYTQAISHFVSKSDDISFEDGLFIGVSKGKFELTDHQNMAIQAIIPSFRLLRDAIVANNELSEANDRFNSLSNSLPGVVYQRIVRPDGKISYTYISESAVDIFGITASEILSNPKALFDSYAPEYREKFRKRLLQASKDMTKWDVEASIILPDGSIRYTHAIASPRKQSDGSVLWTGVIMDASRIKKAEQDAANSAITTRRDIIESLDQGFAMFDQNDELVLFNSVFKDIFNKGEGFAHLGQNYSDFILKEMQIGNLDSFSVKRLTVMHEERLAGHQRGNKYNAEYQMDEECWLQVNEHKTNDGKTVVVYTDVSEIKFREAKIQHMAMHDTLTGLPNRMLFRDRGQQAIRDAHRYNTNTAILALDLDNFKNVNDTLGHPAGDRLLQVATNLISKVIRDTDTLARLGGDEFAIIMRDIDDLNKIELISKRIIDVLGEPIDLNGHQVVVGVSIGVAVCDADTIDQDDLLKNADLALYRAKSDGKNTFRFFDRSMDELTRSRLRMENDLRTALNESHLELHFQPQVNVSRREISGFEALVRWNHPERGSVSPSDFITIAEETGLINQLGEWVIYNACKCAASWSKPSKIAVNLSPAQFTSSDLVGYIEGVLEETGLDPNRLELEITEGMLLHNTSDTVEKLFRLKGLGISIAMDDFGTGYSSLGNLRSFPFDRIKIDKSFVLNLETNPESAAIIKAVVGLGKSLGMNTTAEGVETLHQLRHLQLEGCSEIQGFYYSHARPNEEIEQLLSGDVDGFESLGLNELVF